MEVLPGPYRDQCWNEGSLFFTEEAFWYLEPIIARHAPAYDHYAFTQIARAAWLAIAADLEALQAALALPVATADLLRQGVVPAGNDRRALNLAADRSALATLLAGFCPWIRARIAEQDTMTILGM
jgi:hypothetical protein